MATTVRKLHNATVTCPFCSGSGKLPHFSRVQNGDCFACRATGRLRDTTAFIGNNRDVVLTVWRHNGEFYSAELRGRTWKTPTCSVEPGTHKEWGRDFFYRPINTAEEAREIWRNAKRLGITTQLAE